MSKLSDIDIPPQPVPSVGGLFVRDVPLKEVEAFQKKFETQEDGEEADPAVVVFELFDKFCCGEDGSSFEDITCPDDVRELGIFKIKMIMQGVMEALDVTGKD